MVDTNDTVTGILVAKHASYVAAFFAGVAYLGVSVETVVILTILMLTDVVMGVLKSASLYGPRSIKSSLLSRGVLAKLLILAIPLNVALAGKGTGINLAITAQGTITVLVLSELYSILGNIYAIRTGVERVEFDAVAFIINKIKTILRHFIQD